MPLPEVPDVPDGELVAERLDGEVPDGEGPDGEERAAAVAEDAVELVMRPSMWAPADRYQSVFILVSAAPGTSAVIQPHWYP